MLSVVSIFLSLSIIFGSNVNVLKAASYIDLLRVHNGTGVSILDLWNAHGYNINDQFIYRSGLIDKPFTYRCPTHIYIIFYTQNSLVFHMIYSEPFSSNAIQDLFLSNLYYASYSIQQTIHINITEHEDIILKATKKGELRQNFYFAVYYPKALTTGYPKYYVTPTYEPVFGNIPGDEHLFIEADLLSIRASYDVGCNLTVNSQNISAAEIKELIKNGQNNGDMKNCDTSNRQGTFYKQSDNGYTVRPNAIILWSETYRSLISCAIRCRQDKDGCKSFFSTPDTKQCTGLSHLENAIDKPANAIHYVPENDICN